MNKQEKICIACPIGCRLIIVKDDNAPKGYKVKGNSCKRGEVYGIEEVTNPTRTLTTTVKISGAYLKRLPVVSNGKIPKDKIFECMDIINGVEVVAPVNAGDVIVEDILETGVDVVASRSMEEVTTRQMKRPLVL